MFRSPSAVDLIVCTGGLGPTEDDLTREALARAIERADGAGRADSRRNPDAFRETRTSHADDQQPPGDGAAGARRCSPNANGTAPGSSRCTDGTTIVLMPGPPREMTPMLDAAHSRSPESGIRSAPLFRRVLKITGRTESDVDATAQPIYGPWTKQDVPVATTILAVFGQIELHLTALAPDRSTADAALDPAVAALRQVLGPSVYSVDGRQIEAVVGDLLRRRDVDGRRRGVVHRRPSGLAIHRCSRQLRLLRPRRRVLQQSGEDRSRRRPGGDDRGQRRRQRGGGGGDGCWHPFAWTSRRWHWHHRHRWPRRRVAGEARWDRGHCRARRRRQARADISVSRRARSDQVPVGAGGVQHAAPHPARTEREWVRRAPLRGNRAERRSARGHRSRATAARAAMGAAARDVRWVRPEHLHVTLVFLGEVAAAPSSAVIEALTRDFEQPPYDMTIGGLGIFPTRGAPRALWAGVPRGFDETVALQGQVTGRIPTTTHRHSARDARAFTPHLTLARWRTATRAGDGCSSSPHTRWRSCR